MGIGMQDLHVYLHVSADLLDSIIRRIKSFFWACQLRDLRNVARALSVPTSGPWSLSICLLDAQSDVFFLIFVPCRSTILPNLL